MAFCLQYFRSFAAKEWKVKCSKTEVVESARRLKSTSIEIANVTDTASRNAKEIKMPILRIDIHGISMVKNGSDVWFHQMGIAANYLVLRFDFPLPNKYIVQITLAHKLKMAFNSCIGTRTNKRNRLKIWANKNVAGCEQESSNTLPSVNSNKFSPNAKEAAQSASLCI